MRIWTWILVSLGSSIAMWYAIWVHDMQLATFFLLFDFVSWNRYKEAVQDWQAKKAESEEKNPSVSL